MSLAAVFPHDDAVAEQAFVVRAGGYLWALPAQSVQAVFRIASIAPVPLAPPAIEGLVNLRGRVVVAVNLARRLLGTDQSVSGSAPSLAVAIEHGADVFALVIDDVGDVASIEPTDRMELPPHVPADLARLTKAWLKTRDGLVPLLDVDRLVDLAADRRSGVDRRATPSRPTGANPP